MAKYDPLRDYLNKQTLRELQLTFREIEDLVGPLPPSAERPQWWANVRNQSSPHVQREAWRAAGYDAFLIAGALKVRFVRVAPEKRILRPVGGAPPKVPPPKLAPPMGGKPALTANALLAGGFELSSRWVMAQDGRLALTAPLPRSPGVYAFALKGLAVYVGVALSGLANRLGFYIRPGSTQHTSRRLNLRLIEELRLVESIDILTASPPDASWNGWPINGATGLEVGLIANFEVPWNMKGV